MNTTTAIFMLTTNNLSELDRGLIDRCILIDMNAPQAIQFLPLAQKIADDFNVVLNSEEIMPIIAACNGSFRNIVHNVARYARRIEGVSMS